MDGPTLKITLVNEGGQVQPAAPVPVQAPAPPTPTVTTPASSRPNPLLDEAMGLTPAPPINSSTLPADQLHSAGATSFNPVEEAHRLLELEARRQQVEEARLAILKEQGKLQETTFDPVVQAGKPLEAEERRQQVEEARLKLVAQRQNLDGPADAQAAGERFDPVSEARQRLEAERRKSQVQAAYENLTQGPGEAQPAGGVGGDGGGAAGLFKLLGMGSLAQLTQLTGGAAGGAAGLGVLAATAGPAALAVGAVAVASHLVAERLDGARHQIELLGQATVQLAGNDYLGAFRTGVDYAAGSLEKIPIVGDALGASLRLAAAPVIAFTEVVGAFVERGKELAQWSPQLTAAGVGADMRATLADIREADRLGPGLAKLTDLQSQAWIELREMLLPIKEVVVDVLVVVLKDIVDLLRAARTSNEIIADGIHTIMKVIVDVASMQFWKAGADIAVHVANISAIAKKYEQKLDQDMGDLSPEAVLDDLMAEVKDWGKFHQQPKVPDANAGMQHAPIFGGILGGP